MAVQEGAADGLQALKRHRAAAAGSRAVLNEVFPPHIAEALVQGRKVTALARSRGTCSHAGLCSRPPARPLSQRHWFKAARFPEFRSHMLSPYYFPPPLCLSRLLTLPLHIRGASAKPQVYGHRGLE